MTLLRNAARALIAELDYPSLAGLGRRAGLATDAAADELAARLGDGFAGDLAGLLNLGRRAELERWCRAFGLGGAGTIGELRARLWRAGAEREAGGAQHLGSDLQPVPVLLGGRLRQLAAGDGVWPPCPRWPRPIPPPVAAVVAPTEPDCLEELLESASELVGVRLGAAGRDKGAFGARIAALLGVVERGLAEPDWRGEVELKSVPVARDRSGYWRVVEDPAVAMLAVEPRGKLGRVLWIARVADAGDSPILSWYYQERTPAVARLHDLHLHTRPKGSAGAVTRGWYLHKRFFTESGFLRSLNG